MVLDEVVFLVVGHVCVVLREEERPRRSYLQSDGELATAACVNRVVDRRTRYLEVERQVMAHTIGYKQVRPVFHHIELVTEFAVEGEIIIGPAKTLTVTDRHTEGAQVFVFIRL